MKILVVQLARLGDIYQTWPCLKALSSQQGNEVHVLVRARFASATKGLPENVKVKLLPNKEVLAHVYQNEDDLAVQELENFCAGLISEKYDKVINLSFSPFSSWLTWKIQPDSTKVRGYTRHADGYFYPVDDNSAYFYAQVGPNKRARVHITHLFAGTAQVDLCTNDLRCGLPLVGKRKIENPYWTIQLCASDTKKSLDSAQWIYLLRLLSERFQRMFVLVGAEGDFNFAETVKLGTGYHNIVNLCGQTTPLDLFDWIGHAEMHIAPDSMTLHIASLVNAPTLNISLNCVNFWETGPLADNSYVLPAQEHTELHAKDIVSIAQAILGEGSTEVGYRYSPGGPESYQACDQRPYSSFSWNLALALYMSGDLPRTSDRLITHGLEKTLSVIELGFQQMELLKTQSNNEVALQILVQVDQLLAEIESLVEPLVPFFRWFNTERVRIPPEDNAQTILRTQSIFTQAHMVVSRLLEESLYEADQACS